MPCLHSLLSGLGLMALVALAAPASAQSGATQPLPDDAIASMTAAMPKKAPAKPAKPHQVLVFINSSGFIHSSIPYAAKALELMGERTGAFKAVVSDDAGMFEPEKLAAFDAVIMDNTTGNPWRPANFDQLTTAEQATAREREARLQKSFVNFVRSGKGLVGIHASTDCSYDWAEYGQMMGGFFDGHPWGAGDTVGVKIDQPKNKLTQPFKGQGFMIKDEIYQFKAPYSREQLTVLLSIDTAKTDMTKAGIKRTDGDFAISWAHSYGQGRVFYCSLGHNNEIFWNPTLLQYYLRGIQYALGDLKVKGINGGQVTAGGSDVTSIKQ